MNANAHKYSGTSLKNLYLLFFAFKLLALNYSREALLQPDHPVRFMRGRLR